LLADLGSAKIDVDEYKAKAAEAGSPPGGQPVREFV
jgi:hypothetical protein